MMRPGRFWRVEWHEGFGWPRCTRHEEAARNYTNEHAALRMLTEISRLPDHHVLIGVWRSNLIRWEPLQPEDLLANGEQDEC
jgi:hypothetical protein